MPNHIKEKIQDKIIKFNDLSKLRRKLTGKRIVFTAGGFDLIHVGHTRYLSEAKKFG